MVSDLLSHVVRSSHIVPPPMMLQPVEGKSLPTDCWFTSTCLQTLMQDHSVNLAVICDRHVPFPHHWRFSRLGSSVQISSYPDASRYWVGTDPIHQPKIPSLSRFEHLHCSSVVYLSISSLRLGQVVGKKFNSMRKSCITEFNRLHTTPDDITDNLYKDFTRQSS